MNVKVVDLESPGSPYASGESILVRGYIEANNLNEEGLIVELACELSGYNGSVTVDPHLLEVSGGNDNFRQSVSCLFESGIITDRIKKNELAKLSAKFEASTKSKYDVYVFNQDLAKLMNDPFSEYGINPDNLMINGKMNSEVLKSGPVLIEIFVDEVQPFSGGENYLPLEVIINDVSNSGDIFILQNLILKLSSNIELSQDENFCDFEFIGFDEGGYIQYALKQDIMDKKINAVCNEDSLKDLRISEERCSKEFKEEISFRCDLITKDLSYEDGDFVQNIIVAESSYIFEVKNAIGLEIKKS